MSVQSETNEPNRFTQAVRFLSELGRNISQEEENYRILKRIHYPFKTNLKKTATVEEKSVKVRYIISSKKRKR